MRLVTKRLGFIATIFSYGKTRIFGIGHHGLPHGSELAARGAKVIKPPENYDYGMRDFDVVDLDGNQLTFGMETPS